MNRLAVDTCEACRTQDLGPMTEDGERYLFTCWDIVVRTRDGRQWVFPQADRDEDKAINFAECVVDHGSINPEKWTECTSPELPDYVTHWWRPEFN